LVVVGQASSRGERHRLAQRLRADGKTWAEIADTLRAQLSVSARAAMRLAHGWTQQQAADEWELRWPDRPKDKKWFSYQERWPNGGRPPSLADLDRLAQLYQCAVTDLLTDLSYQHLDPATRSDLDAPTAVKASPPDVTGAAMGLGVELWDLHEVLRSGRVSAEVLELAERAGDQLDARFAELPPTVLSSELGRQFEHMVGWLHDPQPVAFRQRLCSLVGRLAGLRAWMYFDTARHDAAEAWFAAGLSAAREAGDHDVAGWLQGAQSLIPIDRQDYRGAHALIEQAQGLAAHAGNQTTRTWLAALEARALAGLGDRGGFAVAHEQLSRQLPQTCLDERRHGMDFVGETLDVAYYEGLSHLLLYQPDLAGASFRAALANLPATRVKARAILLLSVAMAAARNDQLDEAAAITTEAVTIASDQPIGRIWQRATDVRRELGPADRTGVVHTLDEQMATFSAALERASPDAVS
jgi:transcriptional regulator with XRE-family HTH domain